MRRLLLALFLLMPICAVSAQEMDIPASESDDSDDYEAAPQDNYIRPEHRLRKRGEPVVEEKIPVQPPAAAIAPDKPEEKKKAPEPAIQSNVVMLQGLNKVMGRVSSFEVPLGTLARFENLEIIARKCWKSPPDESPENSALLEIREIKAGEEPKQVFLGWMLSSSPGLSALEHPVYDITVLSCEFKKNIEN